MIKTFATIDAPESMPMIFLYKDEKYLYYIMYTFNSFGTVRVHEQRLQLFSLMNNL